MRAEIVPVLDTPACTIRVRGQVQGVGFRPFVWQLAQELGLAGEVANDGQGVVIAAHGPQAALDLFVARLREDAPPLARVQEIVLSWSDHVEAHEGFTIAASKGGEAATGIVADAATCAACLSEIRDRDDRRHRHAFANCTHCGPRFSIIRKVPYDRAYTSMAAFAMCEACAAEYGNPADRRFHAQPVACPDCGPRLWLEREGENASEDSPITAAARMLRAGDILAIKGIGGFHLACLAEDAKAVAALRQRKARDAKPFALMVPSLDHARRYCEVSEEAAQSLASAASPIVLLPRKSCAPALPSGIAPDQDRLGVMLPYTPLHHLLLAQLDTPLVMTSGNLSDEPQITDNAEAREKLAEIVDGWLMHDRDIVNRIDDSVVTFDGGAPMVLRRARGMAPDPIILPETLRCDQPVLAMGGELKATFCLLRGSEAIVSQHIGDLEDAAALADYRRMLLLFRQLYDFEPAIIAVDAHSDYLSAKLGRVMAQETGMRLVTVAHHHAHMAACLAENGIDAGTRASGIIADGLGLGADGQLWGGEVLCGGYGAVDRVAALPAVALAGGNAAIRQPWRNAVAHLATAFGPRWRSEVPDLCAHLTDDGSVKLIEQMIAAQLNSPPCSSAGRLFDAAAAMLGIHAERLAFEGQAAMALEALARPFADDAAPYRLGAMLRDKAGVLRSDLSPLWQGMAGDVADGAATGWIAARFHQTLCALFIALLDHSGAMRAEHPVALSGGVLQNQILRRSLRTALTERGLRPLTHQRVPANDGGLSLGQAAIAAALYNNGQIEC